MVSTEATSSTPQATDDWRSELDRWRARYVERLANPRGWWGISTLAWLEEGPNAIGGRGAAVPLPERFGVEPLVSATSVGERVEVVAAPHATLLQGGERVTEPVIIDEDAHFDLAQPGDEGAPERSGVELEFIKRGDLWGVRVHDPLLAAAADPAERVAWFGPDPAWVVLAEVVPADAGEEVAISNVLGQVTMQPVACRVRFEVDGHACELIATNGDDGRLFLNFRDAGNQDLDAPDSKPTPTYSGGRFLVTPAPADGRVTIDFNRAYHPPCAHTAYATCPVPPLGNFVGVAVTAGERLPG